MDDAVRDYIDAIAPEHRPLFDRLHRLVLEAHPDAAVVLSYQIPTYKVGRRRLFVGVWKHGVSIYGWQRGRDAGFTDRHPELTGEPRLDVARVVLGAVGRPAHDPIEDVADLGLERRLVVEPRELREELADLQSLVARKVEAELGVDHALGRGIAQQERRRGPAGEHERRCRRDDSNRLHCQRHVWWNNHAVRNSEEDLGQLGNRRQDDYIYVER